MRWTGAYGAGPPHRLPAQRAVMWMMVDGLRGRAAEHVIEQAQQSLEAFRR
jgi:hypothetical protein